MKILMLTSRFGSGYGMGYSSFKEAMSLLKNGCEVTVVHCNKDIEQFIDKRIKYYYLPKSKIYLVEYIILFFRLNSLFKYKINLNDFDCIYIQSLEFGLVKFENIRKPFYYFSRSTMIGLENSLISEGYVKNIFRRINLKILIWLERRCFKNAKAVIVKSNNMLKEVEDLYQVESGKIFVVSGGVDAVDFDINMSKTTELAFKAINGKIFLYAGRIVPQKGLKYLICAAVDLLDKFKFTILIAGSIENNDYYNEILSIIYKSKHRHSFLFLGHVNQFDMNRVYLLSSCLVTPSLYEPFGMVNLQAAFVGRDIITTSIVGSNEILRAYKGISIINPFSAEELANEMEKYILNPNDLSENCFDYHEYSWEVVGKKLLNIFTL